MDQLLSRQFKKGSQQIRFIDFINVPMFMEPASEIKVLREADVVVGGGPGGHAAAISAARNGADTVLLERYVKERGVRQR